MSIMKIFEWICDDLDTILVVGPFYVVPIFAMVIWIMGMFR
ncbi:hypothetical protein [Methanobrevibacter sp.]